MSSPIASIAALTCFITVTSKGNEGKMLIAQSSIATVEGVSQSCNYGVSITLKNGRTICVLDPIEKIARSLEQQKPCD